LKEWTDGQMDGCGRMDEKLPKGKYDKA